MLTAIAAVSQSWGIGRDGDLLFNIPEDKKFFRRTTLNHTVVMGRKTLESLPGGKPFKDRENIVLSRNIDFSIKEVATAAMEPSLSEVATAAMEPSLSEVATAAMGPSLSEVATAAMRPSLSEVATIVCHSIKEVFALLENTKDEEIFIVGGGEIYKAMLPYCQKAIITKVSGDPEADTFFPNLDESPEWELLEESEEQEHEGLKFRFCTYKKI